MSKSIAPKTGVFAAALVMGLGICTGALAQSPCVAPPAWTSHAAVPAPDNDTEPTSNCAFHVWAWNTFLWMTQDAGDGKLLFETFATIDELFDPNATLQSFVELPKQKRLVLTARSTKSSSMEGLDSIFQAGSNGVLIHPGNDGATIGRTVYYSQNVNREFYEFVRNNGYQNADTYLAAPAETNFATGAMEFKYSWKVVEEGEDTSGFFTTEADILLLTEVDGKVVTDPGKTATVNVALVGVHVVGVVENHPEFIWATFEHAGNAPDLPPGVLASSDQPVSDRDYTFYTAGTAAKDGNLSNADTVKLVDADAQLVSPVINAFRQFAWGGGDADNQANIQSLNKSVLTGVLADDPIWSNYLLIGAVWGPPNSISPLLPNQLVPSFGSVKLSNVTMETFTQSGANCFTCHSTFQSVKHGVMLPGKNMNVSHIMTNGYFAQRKATAKALHTE